MKSFIFQLSRLFLPAVLLCLRFFVTWTVHGDSLGKYIRVDCHFLFQGLFPTQASNPGLWHAGGDFTDWATREGWQYWSGQPIPSPGDYTDPGIKPGSLALQAYFIFNNWTTRKHLHLYPRAKYHRRPCLSPATCSHPSPVPEEESIRAQRLEILVSWLQSVVSCFADVPSLFFLPGDSEISVYICGCALI